MFKPLNEYADEQVKNKGMMARISHSPSLHKWRSAISNKQSSGLSKALNFVGKAAAFGALQIPVPLPGVKNIIAVVITKVQQKVSSYYHSKALKTEVLADIAKFELKEMKVDDLDRLRWKCNEAVNQYNTMLNKLAADNAKSSKDHKPCNTWLEGAKAFAQVERRYAILDMRLDALRGVIANVQRYSDEEKEKMKAPKKGYYKAYKEYMEGEAKFADMMEDKKQKGTGQLVTIVEGGKKVNSCLSGDDVLDIMHEKCGDHCFVKGTQKKRGTSWLTSRDTLASFIKTLAEPFPIASIVGISVGEGLKEANREKE
jgi:hypothetical protein